MRTLIVSDLHLGQRPGHDVLRRPEPLARLLAAIDGVDRLVLLGDVVELQSWVSGRRAMEVATPILRAIGHRLGPEREVVIVPGNHDGVMIRAWTLARGPALGIADDVPVDATPELAGVTALLAPARVRVSYPGVWLDDGVWATHGHYIDRHLIPETTFGLPRGRLGRGRGGAPRGAAAIDYERARRRRRQSAARGFWTRVRERPLAMALEQVAELTRYGTWLLRGLHLTGLTTSVIDLQMRHGAVPAIAHVAQRLGVGAEWVVFGHVHRLGPDAGERWQPRTGGPRVLNTGSWVYEPLLLDDASPPHPYWPGGAILLESGRAPRPIRLLDELTGDRLVAAR